MGQRLARCCSCFASCCSSSSLGSASNANASLVKPTLQSLEEGEDGVMKQPLVVVEDESWKRWSSYNLIHHPPDAKKQEGAYNPPAFVSSPQQQQQQHIPAEAVWDL